MDTRAFQSRGERLRETMGKDPDALKGLAGFATLRMSTLLVRTEMARQVGKFDVYLNYAEDHDFLFRLALATTFCYVHRPLCVIDRSKSPQGSNCRPWDQVEVRLRGSQVMFEKWLKLDIQLPADVRKILIHNLRHVYSAWTNWYLEQGRYVEARQAVSRALEYELTVALAIKWALTKVAPTLARRISPRMTVA